MTVKIAKESEKTRKAREKLRRRLEAIDQKITPHALEKKSIEIHRWIARHAPQRVALKTKAISLFDENKNTASISQKINKIAAMIQNT